VLGKIKKGGHMSNSKQIVSWANFKLNLQARSKWLDAFEDSATIQAIARIESKPHNSYEPLLLENLLKEASAALDRCLLKRREAYDLEIAAVKAAADYELFLELAEIDALLETNALATEKLKKEINGYRDSASMFKIDNGFAKHDETLSESAQEELTAAAERLDLLKKRWLIRKKYESEYNLRHTMPGNAHNFKERMNRAVTLLSDDLQEAYEKILAVQIGLKAIYGNSISVPDLQGENVLDELVLWTREVIRFLDIESQEEVSYDLVIPLTQPWRPSEESIIDEDVFHSCVKKKDPMAIFSFDLSDVFFNQERVRLRGFGLAFGSPASYSYEALRFCRLRATVHTPKQTKVNEPGSYYFRPPIVLGNIAVHGGDQPLNINYGLECRNIDPRGEWKIVVNKLAVAADNDRVSIDKVFGANLRDLKLYLKVVAKPVHNPDSVFVPTTQS
jgi:hypothetical protein